MWCFLYVILVIPLNKAALFGGVAQPSRHLPLGKAVTVLLDASSETV